MIRLDEKQYRAVKKMTRAACANNDCGNCEALRGMRQHVCGGQQPGEILPRLRGKDTPQTESPKREKQAFTDKNNYIASTANEYPFARNARASHRERGHFACWDSPKPLYDRERT